ncbi:hypothetical protein BJF90_32985 [Pseudonocardia sp. CNS-004]|nr:hypothetical protein BJF90_32985 [Pseudonocardia sp. CNS-004]
MRLRSSPGACGPRSNSTVSSANSGSPTPRCSSSRWWNFTTRDPAPVHTGRTSSRSLSSFSVACSNDSS